MGLIDENEAIYRDVERVVIHPKRIFYGLHEFAKYHDIALLKLRKRITSVFNETHYIINSICLPKTNITNRRDESLVIIGMGYPKRIVQYWTPQLKKGLGVLERPRTYRETLRGQPSKMRVHFMSSQNQNPLYKSSACHGDSGSPSHQYYGWQAIQIGLVSSGGSLTEGEICADLGFYTRLSLFMPWIRSHLLVPKLADVTTDSTISGTHRESEIRNESQISDLSIVSVFVFITIHIAIVVSLVVI